jgi:hypothetical protein
MGVASDIEGGPQMTNWDEFNARKPKVKQHLDPRDWTQPDEPLCEVYEPRYSIPEWATSWIAIMALVVFVLALIIYFFAR